MELFNEPLSIRDVTLRNRVGMSPMCMYSSSDGFASDWHLVHYGARALGGAALIIQEATAVAPEGRITPYDLGIWKDEHISSLRKITRFIVSQGAIPAIQLAHAGRKASYDKPSDGAKFLLPENGGWEVVAPSPIGFSPEGGIPLELSEQDIRGVISQFSDAARRAVESGYQIVEIHAAHGYLIQEFLSPLSNLRTDCYGGDFGNRIRLLLEIIEAVRAVMYSGMPLFVRISASDWADGGWTIEDSVMLARILQTKGVDLIDCSSGGNISTSKIPLEPLYQVPFAQAVRNTGIKTAAVGLITHKHQIGSILEAGQADIVLLGRELLRNPYFVGQATGVTPEQYARAW